MLRVSKAICCLCLSAIPFGGFAQEDQKKSNDNDPPSFAEMVAEHRDYKPGDLITWDDVKPYIAELKEHGTEIPNEEKLPSLFLSESDRVVKMLRTRKGTKFMRNLAKAGGTYDTLDRFRKLPRGYIMLQTMIDTPKGEQLLAEMTTTKTGRGTARQLSRDPKGKDFTKPTGLIYTEDALKEYLEKPEETTGSDEPTASSIE